MYLRHTTVRKNGKTHTYWRLVRSVRRAGKWCRRRSRSWANSTGKDGRGPAPGLPDHGAEEQYELFEAPPGASRLRCGWTRSAWSASAVSATSGWAGSCGARWVSIVSTRPI